MSNYFMKVDKGLFAIGLTPIEILVISQITEFQNNTGDCFISDKVLAENFGVSESTISRTLKALEAKGIIVRTTKNVRGGKERHLAVNLAKLNNDLTTGKMTVEKDLQASNCSLSTSKLTVDNKQNDLIKDNINKIKEEDNNGVDKTASLRSAVIINSSDSQKEEVTEIAAYKLRAMGARYEFISNDLVRICDTGKVFRVYGY